MTARTLTVHFSDCAVHNAPAFAPGPCDCDTDLASMPNVAGAHREYIWPRLDRGWERQQSRSQLISGQQRMLHLFNRKPF